MTRINIGIPPKKLCQQHLIAEHREIKRIPNMVREGKFKSIGPAKFTLGTGHVLFFVNKLGYLLDRYREIRDECWRRGYLVENYESCWEGLPRGQEWVPTTAEVQLLVDRINEKLKSIKNGELYKLEPANAWWSTTGSRPSSETG